jgi:hypothetical protein
LPSSDRIRDERWRSQVQFFERFVADPANYKVGM